LTNLPGHPANHPVAAAPANASMAPSLTGGDTLAEFSAVEHGGLHGKVVLVDFWTYSCINCLRRCLTLKHGPKNI